MPPSPAPDPGRRDPVVHQAILDATVELLESGGYQALSVEGIARRAKVGKQTIYRWWGGSLPALVMEAFLEVGDRRVPLLDTGSVRGDLLAILVPVFALSADRDRGTALANRTLMAQAQLDPDFGQRWMAVHQAWHGPMLAALERGRRRGELRPDVQPQAVVDAILGFAWYRLLLGHGSLEAGDAEVVVDLVLLGSLAAR